MILLIKQIGLSLRGRPILLITRMITERIGLLSPVTITNRFLFFRGCRSVDILFYLCIMLYGNIFLMKIQTNVNHVKENINTITFLSETSHTIKIQNFDHQNWSNVFVLEPMFSLPG